ncbi:MAG TPA: galactan 5-O-arabinofuranosyltransferase, partial [Corynebacterium sp.]|nr:galactan 5-O-arabinofuranosyltransferase [Corynebacterium sp.]
ATLLGAVAALLGGGLAALLAWFLLDKTNLPAFNTSMVTRALASAAAIIILGLVAALLTWWVLDRRRPRWRVQLTYLLSYLAPAGLVVAVVAIPLSASRLYLDGMQVDQEFRVQFLGRMATTWANQDMNYADLPTYYPLGWFWLGGRLAMLLGMPGWEVYQPWAIVSLAAGASLLVPVWQRLSGSLPVATATALITTAITLVMAADEPYAAVIAMMVPAMTILARRAVHGSRWAMAAMILLLGVSASFYTLYTGAAALMTVIVALVVAATQRTWLPVLRLIIIGVGSILLALICWGPYLWAVLSGQPSEPAAAQNFLPVESTWVPVPFLALSVIGLLSLVGLVYLILRFRPDRDIRAMGVGLLVFYGWALASMLISLLGTTLLGFRIDTLIAVQFATLGVLGLAALPQAGLHRLFPAGVSAERRRQGTVLLAVLVLLSGIHYAQRIPERNEDALDHAYTDTDGYGDRADRFPPDAAGHYPRVDEEIRSHGHEPTDTVVLTDDNRFLSFNPYYGFNAFTAHYANPLGTYQARNDVIERWAAESWEELAEPEDFAAALDEAPWRAPDVFIFRADLAAMTDPAQDSEGWKSHLARDLYPNDPNIRFDAIFFNPEVFAEESLWATAQIGPFVVVTRVGAGDNDVE